MHRKSLVLNMLYMGLNMIFLPLTGLVSIKEFVSLFINGEEEFF